MREAVLEAALNELEQKGFDHFSIASVARAAGVHETSIYRRWGTRTALVLEAVRDAGHAPVPDTGTILGDLRQLLVDSRSLMNAPMGRCFAALALSAEPDTEFYPALKEFWAQRLAGLEQIFVRAAARGEWDPAVPARPRLDALLGAVVWRISITKEAMSDAYIDELVGLMCRDGIVEANATA